MSYRRSILFLVLLSLVGCEENRSQQQAPAPQPVLIQLAERGDFPALDRLLKDRNPDVLDQCQWTPLMKAVQNGHFATARRLLEAGADPNAQDKGGYTPLLFAAAQGHEALIDLLLDYGAEIDHQEHSSGWTALIWAAKAGQERSVRRLLERGANPEIRDFSGQRARDWAVRKGWTAIADLLP